MCRPKTGLTTIPGLIGLAIAAMGFAHDATAQVASPEQEAHREWGVLPALGYDPDTGLEIGVFTHLAQIDPRAHPYRWRVRAQILTSILDDDGVEFPKQEHYLRLDLPELPDPQSRLRFDLTWEKQVNSGYFGVGNAARAGDPAVDGAKFHEYGFETVSFAAGIDRALWSRHWRGFAKTGASRLDVRAPAQSRLERDLAAGGQLPGVGKYTSVSLAFGLMLDTRDHETIPTRGLYHDLVIGGTPSISGSPQWARITYTARFYFPIAGERLVFASRILGDVLLGDASLRALGEHGGVHGARSFGSAGGVRGITGGRFIGKTKALGSVALRSQLLPFRFLGESMNLGAATFLDAGRVWSKTLAPDPERDGEGLGIHWGAGAGARWRWGDSLLIRLDFAHSPNTSDFGGGEVATYLVADSVF